MTLKKRTPVVSFVAAGLLCWCQQEAAIAHGPQRPHPSTEETAPRARAQNSAVNLLDPRVRLALKQAQLGGLAGGLRQIAQRVVTDLNDDVNDLNQLTGTISRQRILQARDLEAGFGMRRWTPEVFERKVDVAYEKASDLIGQYRQIMPWITVVISDDGLKMDGVTDRLECLAARTEYVAVEFTNRTQRPRPFNVSGNVAGKAVAPSAGSVAPLSTAFALVELSKQQPGAVEVSLTCAAGEESVSGKWQASIKPSHELTLKIVNAATELPCAARAFIRGSDGRYWIADERAVILAGQRNIMKFGYANETVKAILPPGEVQLKLQKGFEYRIAERTESISGSRSRLQTVNRNS